MWSLLKMDEVEINVEKIHELKKRVDDLRR